LPMTTAPQAHLVAERIRAGVDAIRVETAQGQAAVTLSIGIAETIHAPQAERLGGDASVERVIHRADDAMYAAKRAGGNRTLTHSAPAERPGGSAR
jgi:PleD family two-component response regulator